MKAYKDLSKEELLTLQDLNWICREENRQLHSSIWKWIL